MNTIEYYIHRVMSKFSYDRNEYMNCCFRAQGMEIGKGVHIFSNIISSEPYLIFIGDNSTISTGVSLLTHDASVGAVGDRSEFSDICGAIRIGKHCFIGNNSIILYGVTIPDRTIVAAGSVVTKSILSEGMIVGGNPAKVIGTVDDYIEKNKDFFLNLHGKSKEEKKKIIMASRRKIR